MFWPFSPIYVEGCSKIILFWYEVGGRNVGVGVELRMCIVTVHSEVT